jgi:hypothetical protein
VVKGVIAKNANKKRQQLVTPFDSLEFQKSEGDVRNLDLAARFDHIKASF